MIDREAIAAEARSWVGTPYHHGASCKGVGADCIGVVVGVADVCGVPEAKQFKAAHEFRGYGRQPDPAMLLRGCALWLAPIDIEDATTGDVLLFRFLREPQHFGLISRKDPIYIVHAYAQVRQVVENRLDKVWRSRVLRAFRFRGLVE